MNICILGDNLSSLSLAKTLINKKISVHLIAEKKIDPISPTRTIGISKSNIEFINKEIIKIGSKNLWNINQIEIFTETLENQKILNFKKNNKELFSIIRNHKLYDLLNLELSKNNLFKRKNINKNYYKKNLDKNLQYDLIINCDDKNFISKKFFFKKINKIYNNLAYTTIIKHKSINNNYSATQIFTKNGPIAFLPISNTQTSIVYSVHSKKNKFDIKTIIHLIKKYNPKYFINKFEAVNSFELKSTNLRNYYYKNYIAFGDLLHKIHPLAGQGFNMTIRDIRVISKIIQNRIDLGLPLDESIGSEFEKETKHKNFIFTSGVDFIYELFNLERKDKTKSLSKMIKFFGNKKYINKVITDYADKGMIL